MIAPRAGFSMIEALATLAITSLALVLMFQVGSAATRTGFRLGHRATDAADAQLGEEAARVALRSLVIPPLRASARGIAAFDGRSDRLHAAALIERPLACAGFGPLAGLSLAVVRAGGRTQLVCRADGANKSALLLDLADAEAAFSYSSDGRSWSDAASLASATGPAPMNAARAPPRRLWVRLSTADGRRQIVEALTSAPLPAG